MEEKKEKNMPEVFRVGNVKGLVWRNEIGEGDDKFVKENYTFEHFFSVKDDKSGDDVFKSSSSFSLSHLFLLRMVIDEIIKSRKPLVVKKPEENAQK